MLRIENRELTEQNNSLMSRLSASTDTRCQESPSQSTVIYNEVHEIVPEKSGAAVESAAFISGPLPRVQVVPLYLLFHLMINLLLVNLEFDLDQLVQQLPEEDCAQQCNVQPSTSAEPLCTQPPCPSSGSTSPVDAGFLNTPRYGSGSCSVIMPGEFVAVEANLDNLFVALMGLLFISASAGILYE
ncbi:hypothetical protein OESDEN_19242 [Oesophagostomum dentatum]|uniref:Uncharacterized protein n=1 Tax=Oesophagostomum dentatum TaxID=61180 RepID=A0A0B1S821_OESDE|nr:hypothetical protein OESDEN_19242 [Oesophagostomum dentatum]